MVKNPPAMQETWVGKIPWRREWLPTPVTLPGKSHGRGAWRAAVPGVAESDMTEQLRFSLFLLQFCLQRVTKGPSEQPLSLDSGQPAPCPKPSPRVSLLRRPCLGRHTHLLPEGHQGFPGGSDGKESTCNVGDSGSIPGSGRLPGKGNGNPLQYSGLENSMDRAAWQATVHGVAESQTQFAD